MLTTLEKCCSEVLTTTKIRYTIRTHPKLKERSFKMASKNVFPLVRNLPVWKFYYRGNHTHPVRTTIAVIENTTNTVTGYVLRRGNDVCARLQDAPIRTFKKSEIASYNQIDSRSKKATNSSRTTLTKHNLVDLIVQGA